MQHIDMSYSNIRKKHALFDLMKTFQEAFEFTCVAAPWFAPSCSNGPVSTARWRHARHKACGLAESETKRVWFSEKQRKLFEEQFCFSPETFDEQRNSECGESHESQFCAFLWVWKRRRQNRCLLLNPFFLRCSNWLFFTSLRIRFTFDNAVLSAVHLCFFKILQS